MSVNASGTETKELVATDVQGINDLNNAAVTRVGTTSGSILGANDEIIPGAPGQPTRFRRRVVRQQEVPYTRKVKVPVFTKKVVPTTFSKRIKTKKLVEVQYFKDVEEKYTVLEEVKKKRMKKTWEKRIIQEQYNKKVPITKKRIVKKPVMKVVEQDDFQLVQIPGTKMIDVHGWRIDEIEERKLIEIEEFEVYELLPHRTGKMIKGMERHMGRIDNTGNRRIGQVIYANGDLDKCGIDWNGIEVDDTTATAQVSRTPLWKNADGYSTFDNGADVRGYTSLHEWNSHFGHEYKTVAPVVVQREKFNLEKCLRFTRIYLDRSRATHGIKDIEMVMQEIESRWRLVDADASGILTHHELRQAVWRRESDNDGVEMPAGKFAPALQDVVDQIYVGCGSKDQFTYWDFADYVINEEHPLQHVHVPVPKDDWADARNQ
jgi:hypothetical protein